MIEKFKTMFKEAKSKWIKIAVIAGAILYCILYITSCSATYKASMRCEHKGDSTTIMTYTQQGGIRK